MSAILPTDRDRLIGYRMPAEWAPHVATYIVWPHNLETWPGKFDPIPLVFARMAAAIAHDWRFNSWGEKYGAFDLDDVVPRRLGERYGFDVIEPGIVLEAGAIEVNGAGSLLTTESCLLNRN